MQSVIVCNYGVKTVTTPVSYYYCRPYTFNAVALTNLRNFLRWLSNRIRCWLRPIGEYTIATMLFISRSAFIKNKWIMIDNHMRKRCSIISWNHWIHTQKRDSSIFKLFFPIRVLQQFGQCIQGTRPIARGIGELSSCGAAKARFHRWIH